MSKFISPITEIIVSENQIINGYKLKVNLYQRSQLFGGLEKKSVPYKPIHSYINTYQGYIIQYVNESGDLHRDDDQPAYIKYNTKDIIVEERWYKNGVLDRNAKDDNNNSKPAVIKIDGTKIWYRNGVIRRDDNYKPTYIYLGIEKRWYKNGQIVRLENPYKREDTIISKTGDIICMDDIKIELPKIKV